MMFPRLRLVNKNQKGFTLLEIVLAMALVGIIGGGISMTLSQLIMGNIRTNNHMTMVRQVQQAGYWVSHDAQMTQIVKLGASPGFLPTLTWTEWGGTKNVVTYTIANGELKRSLSVNGGTARDTIVARFIDSSIDPITNKPRTKCGLSGGGTFSLPDTNDAFTITGGAVADSGTITKASGSISLVSTSGGASYSASTGDWATPAAGATAPTIVIRASVAPAGGIWTSTASSATIAITTDSDGDAIATGRVLVLTVTASMGTGSQKRSETRVYEIVPRPG